MSLPQESVQIAKLLVENLKKDPELLHHPDLGFLKAYLESLGAKIPAPKPKEQPKPAEKPKEQPKPQPTKAPEPEPAVEEVPMEEEPPEEADPELWAVDEEPTQDMGTAGPEPSDDDNSKAMGLFSEGRGLVAGNPAEAVNKLTEAIKLNPGKAVFFASRAEAFFKQKKPKAAIKDATRALELNPDQAKAYKVRGKAKRFLGQYEEGILDLHTGQKLDWDEDTQAVIDGIKARVETINKRKREAEKKRQEREFAERKRRVEEQRRAQEEARKRQAEEAAEEDDDMPDLGGMGGGGGMGGIPPELFAALQDPAMQKLLQDPEVMGLFTDANLRNKVMEAASDPTKHANDAKVQALLKKVAPLLAKIGSMKGGAPGAGRGGGFPGGGFPGGGFPGGGFPGGGFPGAGGADDLDVD